MDFSLPLVALLIAAFVLTTVYAYLAWFKPDRFKELGQPPKSIRNLLGHSFEFLWRGGHSDLALWLTRLVAPVAAVTLLALLVEMLLYALGL